MYGDGQDGEREMGDGRDTGVHVMDVAEGMWSTVDEEVRQSI